MDLNIQFHEDMKDIYIRAKKECGYIATRFLQMLGTKGGVETAKNLIKKENGTEGFEKLWEMGRLDLSVEALVLNEKYKELFTDEEREICTERLRKYGFSIT